MISDGESDNNSCRNTYCCSDRERQWRWELRCDSAVPFDAKFQCCALLWGGATQIVVVQKSTARWVPRFCLRLFRCCSVRLKPIWTASHRTVRQTTPWQTFVFLGTPLGGDTVPPMFSPNIYIYPRHIVNASGLLVTLGMAMRPPDRSPVRARVELKSCHERITLLTHFPSSYTYLFHRNRYISNMWLNILWYIPGTPCVH